jgi:hypothetical protein
MWQNERDQRRDDERAAHERAVSLDVRHEDILRAYLTQMSSLMLDRNLLRSQPNADARKVARTLTLAAVRRLDGERKGQVVRFLYEARALDPADSKVNVYDADLRGAKLADALLPGAALSGADLRGADLQRATLAEAWLDGANLSGAHLNGATLAHADLGGACVSGAHFDSANLLDVTAYGVEGSTVTFDGALLVRASFGGAQLTNVSLRRSRVEGAEFPPGWTSTGLNLSRAETAELCSLPLARVRHREEIVNRRRRPAGRRPS